MATTAVSAPMSPFWQRRSFRRAITGWAFATPILVYFALWVFGPILFSMGFVFFEWNGVGALSDARFVALGNLQALTHDQNYIGAFRNTFAYALIVVTFGVSLGLILALAVNGVSKFVSLVRGIYYLPVILPGTAMALLWGMMYQPRYGLINQILGAIGLPRFTWLQSMDQALQSIAIMMIWKSMGWYMILFLAGLKSIPQEFYEAARIDGANGRQQFMHMTLPLLRPTLLFVLVIAVINSLQVFGPAYIMTQGGPANATNVVVYNVYMTAFQFGRFGYATAQAAVLFLAMFAVTLVQMRLFREGGVVSYYN